jgi:hypothetical protein
MVSGNIYVHIVIHHTRILIYCSEYKINDTYNGFQLSSFVFWLISSYFSNQKSKFSFSMSFHSKLSPHCKDTIPKIFPEKELRGISPSFHIHVSVSDLYIPWIGLPVLLHENMWTDSGNI